MISQLLESRIVDILLILLAMYFVFPRLFKRNNHDPKSNISSKAKVTKDTSLNKNDKKGEYIDYEEIK